MFSEELFTDMILGDIYVGYRLAISFVAPL